MRPPKPEAERTANAKRVAKSRAKKDAALADALTEVERLKAEVKRLEIDNAKWVGLLAGVKREEMAKQLKDAQEALDRQEGSWWVRVGKWLGVVP